MLGIIGIIAMLTVLGLSLLITKLATTALTMTGLSEEAARFQARSAFTGTGFTTAEAEKVVDHPVRRRIVMYLFIFRSAGLVTVVISLIFSFAGEGTGEQKLYRLLYLAGGVFVLLLATQLRWVDRALRRGMERLLQRWTGLDTRDYASLLRLSGEYTVMELQVQEGDWVAGKKLQDCQLRKEGILVLGLTRDDGSYVGAPHGNTEIYPGDTLLLYGRGDDLAELSKRQAGGAGDAAHVEAEREQEEHVAEQERQEAARRARRQAQEKEKQQARAAQRRHAEQADTEKGESEHREPRRE
ncbi:MAG: TrkA C-terminal domain-containing protein [Planctomycetota bacterium]